MINDQGDIGITDSIKMLEGLKSQLLNNIAKLYENMIDLKHNEENIGILSDMVIITYLLSQKIGISFEELDESIIHKIKIELSTNKDSRWTDIMKELIIHLDETRNIGRG